MTLWERLKRLGRRTGESWGLLDPRLAEAFGITDTAAGISVNTRVAEAQATVFACWQAIASAVAMLPVNVYRREGENRIEDPDHPLAKLVRAGPNAQQTWPDFSESMVASVVGRGNALAEIVRDQSGRLAGLKFIPWDLVSVQLLKSGRLAFDIYETIGGSANRRRLLQEEVIFLKDRSDDGLVGRSRLSRAAEVIGSASAAQQFAASFFKNSANPSGAVQTDAKLGEEGFKQLRERLKQGFVGPSKAGRLLLLDNGLKWQQITIAPEDAELLETRRFSVEELCRIYQVPPPIVQDYTHNTFTNSETAGRWFAQFTIGPWARKIEAEFARAIFAPGEPYEIELDMSGFLRGDPLSRWQAHQIALQNKVLTPNEVRQTEGWNPRAGGDEFEQPKPQPQPDPVKDAA